MTLPLLAFWYIVAISVLSGAWLLLMGLEWLWRHTRSVKPSDTELRSLHSAKQK